MSSSLEFRLGDWRDVLPGTYDPARSVVITDPPYGLDAGKGYDDTVPWAQHVRDVLAMLPAVRHVIRGPAVSILQRDYPQPRRMAVEMVAFRRRAALRPGVIPYCWQGWCVYGRLSVGRDRRPEAPSGDARLIRAYDRTHSSTRSGEHKGVTPYAAVQWIIGDWAEFGPGWLILDPFAGTGTIGRVASAYGIDYIGAERDPRWYAEAMATSEYAQPMLVFG